MQNITKKVMDATAAERFRLLERAFGVIMDLDEKQLSELLKRMVANEERAS